ncbi:hypothetical protein [Shewanella pealeana]|uniref:LRAT domain-containing protein n=1 Tax=Shewanella pealeana (strain ATCC 700345 / ANG-SQ1) TaxID=398579 RepID=A8H220_SHEPA|nr:hypothetical protein [Shewanella pealeana]ABV86607.1 hypothetical protein Spea_1280 [Shewanella pealeana ATCC 700345]
MLLNENNRNDRVLTSVTKVYRKKVSGLVAHAGLMLSFEQGEQLVLHTNPDKNTHLSTLEEFLEGEKLVKKACINATPQIVDRINSRLSSCCKYSIFYNCEHLTSEVLTGSSTSEQLKTTLTVSALGTAFVAFKPANRNMMTLSLAALGFGLLGLYIEKQNQLSS